MGSKQSAERRRSLITGLLAIGVFLALHPIVLEYYSTRFLGGAVGDGGLYVWLVQSFINDPWKALTFETNALYPYPVTRAWSDPFFLPAFVVLLFTKVGLSFPAAYNSTIVLTFASNAVACTLLAQRIGLAPSLAVAVGVLFANSSYIVGNLGHPQLLFFFWIPLAWWCVLAPSTHERASSRSWCAAGFCVAGAFFSAVYYAIFAAIGLAIIWFRDLLYGRFSSRRALRTILFATVGASPIIYALSVFLPIQRLFGARGLHEAAHFAATGLSYLSFTPLHDIYARSAMLSHSEAHLSPGYLIALIAVVSIVTSCWHRSRALALAVLIAAVTLLIASSVIDTSNRSEQLLCISAWVLLVGSLAYTLRSHSALSCFALIVVVFFLFSFGPGGNPHKHEPAFSPLGILFVKVPGLAAVRAVGRYGSVVILGVIIAAAYGIQRYISSNRRRSIEIPQLAAATIFLILGLVDNLVTTIPFDAPLPPAQAFTALASDPTARGAALILPFTTQSSADRQDSWSKIAILNSRYALWESSISRHSIKLVNGYSGQRSKIQMQLPRVTRNFPDTASLDYFARICGLRYVIVVPGLYDVWDNDQFSQRLSESAEAFSAVQRFDDGSILLTLARRTVSTTDGTLAPFFAPRDRSVQFHITPQTSEQCLVTATSLGRATSATRAVSGERVALQSSEYALRHEQSVILPPPQSLTAASPHFIELSTRYCVAKVRCDVAD
jgi:hypothetical protein